MGKKKPLKIRCPQCGERKVERGFLDRNGIPAKTCNKCRDNVEIDASRPHHCVDCGEPTTDHRCPECLIQWRRDNGVPEDIRHIHGDTYSYHGD